MSLLEKQKRSREPTKTARLNGNADLNPGAKAFVPTAIRPDSLVKQVLVKSTCESNAKALHLSAEKAKTIVESVATQLPAISLEPTVEAESKQRDLLTTTEAELTKLRLVAARALFIILLSLLHALVYINII